MKKNLVIEYLHLGFEEISSDKIVKGINECYLNKENAYAPYSHFSVVCSIVFTDGEILTATNQENIVFPSGICAEANAISYSGSKYPNKEVEAIVLVAFNEKMDEATFVSPCGNCRQIMLEFESRQEKSIELFFGSKNAGFYNFKSCKDLMPLFFSNETSELN